MKILNDYSLRIGSDRYKPLVIGAMGVDISTKELALAAANLGAVGHISDAMIGVVADRHLGTRFVSEKRHANASYANGDDKSDVRFDAGAVREAAGRYAAYVMKDKRGPGAVFANCMEKLTMNGGREILSARLNGLLDGGVDGITLSAGLHLGSFSLIKDHPRFNDAKLGIIVSSARALKMFLMKNKKLGRVPDYVIVEGPLAGGHLGFSASDLETETLEQCLVSVVEFLADEGLEIPVIAAGGIFTGDDAVKMIALGAAGVQVATRFTIARECGFPDAVKHAYLDAEAEDIVVRSVSPTGYPMRLLKQSPVFGVKPRPNCEAYGYLISNHGRCAYVDQCTAQAGGEAVDGDNAVICLCSAMKNYRCWTCGAATHRLKETVRRAPNGEYVLPSAAEIIEDYLYGSVGDFAHAPVQHARYGHVACLG